GLWVLALVLTMTTFTVGTVDAVSGSVMAAGAFALFGAVYWWVYDLTAKSRAATAATTQATDVDSDDAPAAMGFGDVKLAVTLGAIGGIIGRLSGGKRMIPFGPYLLLGALCALFFGSGIIDWYLGLLGAV